MPSAAPATEHEQIDILVSVAVHRQTTDGVGYETGYAYNLSGAMVEQRYPSGRVVKNALDDNGDLSMVQSARCLDWTPGTNAACTAQAGLWNYARHFSYNAAGAVTSMQLGNGRWESTVFNSRLQPVQIALGSTVTAEQAYDLLKLDYGYGGANNNGNVLSQTITVKRPNQSDLVFDQLYTYDSLNRISSAEEKTGTTVNWNQTYTFDRYGNRNFNESLTTTLPKGCMDGSTPVVCEADKKMLDPALDPANNRMASGQGWSYDAAGNVIGDPQGRSFFYDAENKQVEVENSLEQSIGRYWFDSDGKRIKKEGLAPNGQPELTVFVYDAGGKLIGEYSTNIETAAPKVQYLTADHLGSPRINTDQNGTVTSRTDYMPYGEEIIALGGRSSNEAYLPDDIRKGFTGYENDEESGLDFAQARMYRNVLGRFTTTDPVLMEPNRAVDPQRINLYAYVRNNPLVLIDPTGQIIDDSSLAEDEKYQKWKAALLATEAGRALWDKYHNDKNFTLMIRHDPNLDNGARTDKYKFKDGKLIGATISIGNDIGDRTDAASRNENQYPLTSALGKEQVDSEVLGAAILAHEFGHVEDANNRAALFQIAQEYSDAIAAEQVKGRKLTDIFADSAIKQKARGVLTAFGAQTWEERDLDTDNRAERTVIPVIQQNYANRGKRIPKGVQNAINKLTGEKK